MQLIKKVNPNYAPVPFLDAEYLEPLNEFLNKQLDYKE